MGKQVDTFLGTAVVSIKEKGVAGGMRFFSNLESLTQSFETEDKTVPDNTAPGGGEWDSITRVTSAKASAVLFDLSPENLALATNGSVVNSSSVTPIVDEVITVVGLTDFYPTARMIDISVPPVVTNSAGTTTYNVGTDYTVSPGGITLVSGTTIVAGGIKIDYTPEATKDVQFLGQSGKEYEVFIDGYNEANSRAFGGKYHRVKFAPTNDLGLIGSDFAKLTVEMTLLADTSITGGTLSQYGRVAFATA